MNHGPVPLQDRAGRREALLDAADRIVHRDGPTATVPPRRWRASRPRPASPSRYRHFGDKGGLHAALADRYTGVLLCDLRSELGVGPVRAAVWAHGVVGMVQAAGDWWLDSPDVTRGELVTELTDLLFGAYGEL